MVNGLTRCDPMLGFSLPAVRRRWFGRDIESAVTAGAWSPALDVEEATMAHRARLATRCGTRLRLPDRVDPDAVEATYDNGLLTITVAKSEQARPRRIPVQAGDGAAVIDSGGGEPAAEQPAGASAGASNDLQQ